jgi:hypothetical protein
VKPFFAPDISAPGSIWRLYRSLQRMSTSRSHREPALSAYGMIAKSLRWRMVSSEESVNFSGSCSSCIVQSKSIGVLFLANNSKLDRLDQFAKGSLMLSSA